MSRKKAVTLLSFFFIVVAGAAALLGLYAPGAATPPDARGPEPSTDFPQPANAPFSPIDTVKVAFWNIRDLSASSRDADERAEIAAILAEFDAIAICEVNDDHILGELEAVLEQDGNQWSSVTSERVGTTNGSSEHYGAIWKDAVFDLVWEKELPDHRLGDLDIGLDELGVDPNRMIDREPYAVALKTDDGRFDFVFVIVHVTWGRRVGPRIAEVRALSAYYKGLLARERDVLVVGDFNRNAGDARSLGWLMQRTGLTDTTTRDTPTSISSTSTYDHVLLHPDYTTEYTGTHGVIRFDETAFANDDDAAKLAVSDHRPVWVELIVPEADDD